MPGARDHPSSEPCTGRRIAGLPPITGSTPRVLVLGSFPSAASLAKNEYYGNPRNHFWPIAGLLFSFDRDIPYVERTALLTERDIALWDVIGSCCREGSADNRIQEPQFNDIGGFIRQFTSVKFIALNGGAAGRCFGELAIAGSIRSEVLPSTSPANARYTLAQKTDRWRVIAQGR